MIGDVNELYNSQVFICLHSLPCISLFSQIQPQKPPNYSQGIQRSASVCF